MSDSESESTGDSSEFASPPTDIDPYAVLSIPRTSTTPEIRTAYRRLALSIHPDKVPASERASAHVKFQQLAFAYAVLSDEARRARYDATGSTSESAFGGDGEAFDWKAFFRQQVKDLVSPEAVEKFKMEYQGSEEERLAVLEAYTGSQGSMDAIFERVMVSSVLDDEERFCTIIQTAIDANEVKAYKSFTKETAKSKKQRRKKAEGEAKEAEEYAKEIGVWDVLFGKKKDTGKKEGMVHSGEAEVAENEDEDEESLTKSKTNGKSRGKPAAYKGGKRIKRVDDTSALEALIKSRQQNRQTDFLSNLEAKYGAGGSEVKENGGRKRVRGRVNKPAKEEEKDGEENVQPTEQEFQAARTKIKNGIKRRGSEKEKAPESSRGTRSSKRVKTG